jgi:hypothetical protein
MSKVREVQAMFSSDPMLRELLEGVPARERGSASWLKAYLVEVGKVDPQFYKSPVYTKAVAALHEAAAEQALSHKLANAMHDPRLIELAGGPERMQYYAENPQAAIEAIAALQSTDPQAYRSPAVQSALGALHEAKPYFGTSVDPEQPEDGDPELEQALAEWREPEVPGPEENLSAPTKTPPPSAPSSTRPNLDGSARSQLDRQWDQALSLAQTNWREYSSPQHQQKLLDLAAARQAEQQAAPAPAAPAPTPTAQGE